MSKSFCHRILAIFFLLFASRGWSQIQPLPLLSQELSLDFRSFDIPEVKLKVLEADRVAEANPLLLSLVMIVNQDSHEICTGSVVGARTVLTAAHCLPVEPHDLVVLAGQDPLNSPNAKILPVSDYLKFASYDKAQRISPYDLALIYFEEDLSNYGLVSLKLRPEPPRSMVFHVAGFGLGNERRPEGLQPNQQLTDGILRSKNLKVDSGLNRGSSFLILQQDEGGLCFGDSGSPALVRNMGKWEIYAIAHSVFSPERPVGAEVAELCSSKARYLKLEAFYAWIQQNTI